MEIYVRALLCAHHIFLESLSKHYHGNLATLPINCRRLFNSWRACLHLPFQPKRASIVRIRPCPEQSREVWLKSILFAKRKCISH